MSFQSIAAKNGNNAEKLLSSSDLVKQAFETYFGKQGKIEMVVGRKKSDNKFVSEDLVIPFQNKNGNIDGRGHSVNRSSLDKLTEDETARILIGNICLKKNKETPLVEKSVSANLVDKCLFSGGESAPKYFTHTKITSGQITELYICSSETLKQAILSSLYSQMLPKRTCVHLSDSIYLQRKAGGKKDHCPDDIQMKIRLKSFIHLFTRLL
jgi:hypothetical protein